MKIEQFIPEIKEFLKTIKSVNSCVITNDGTGITLSKINNTKLEIRSDFFYMLYQSSCKEEIAEYLDNSKLNVDTALEIAEELRYLFISFHNDLPYKTRARVERVEQVIKENRIKTSKYKQSKLEKALL